MRRAKTLTRPERGVAPVPLINPQVPALPATTSAGAAVNSDAYNGSSAWRIFSRIVTFWAPDVVLSSVGGLKDASVRQAWREKITLCFIIAVLCGAVGFATVGFQRVLCPPDAQSDARFIRVGLLDSHVLGIEGKVYNATNAKSTEAFNLASLLRAPGQDITPLFQREASRYDKCSAKQFRAARISPCTDQQPCALPPINSTSTFSTLGLVETTFKSGYAWEQVTALANYVVIDGSVLNFTPYLRAQLTPLPDDPVDKAIRTVVSSDNNKSGKDATRLFYNRKELIEAVPCLKQRYLAGNIDKVTPGCFATNLFLYAGLIVILGLVMIRFVMACIFNWFLSESLAGPINKKELERTAISPAVLPGGANISIDNKTGTAPWANPAGTKLNKAIKSPRSAADSSSTTLINSADSPAPVMSLAQIGAELFAVCLVTCYSEGEESLRTTLDSISTTTYSDARKLLFVVADGMITGAGEKRSTPDICVGLLEADPRFGNPIPMSYNAVGSGSKANNRAMVYAGHYSASCF